MRKNALKSLLAGSIILSSLSLSAAPNDGVVTAVKPRTGVFLGLGVGAGAITRSVDVEGGSRQSNDISLGVGFNWEAKLGWQQYFTRNHGVRAYMSYDQTWGWPGQYGTHKLKILRADYVLVDRYLLNVDYLLDLINEGNRRAGIYAGIYAGWGESNHKLSKTSSSNEATTQDPIKDLLSNNGNNYNNGFLFGINAGVSVTIIGMHRIDLGARIPLYDIKSKEYVSPSSNQLYKTDATWKVPTFTLTYNFIF